MAPFPMLGPHTSEPAIRLGNQQDAVAAPCRAARCVNNISRVGARIIEQPQFAAHAHRTGSENVMRVCRQSVYIRLKSRCRSGGSRGGPGATGAEIIGARSKESGACPMRDARGNAQRCCARVHCGLCVTSGCTGVSPILRAIETNALPACCPRILLHSQRGGRSALHCLYESAAAAGGEGQTGGWRSLRCDSFA